MVMTFFSATHKLFDQDNWTTYTKFSLELTGFSLSINCFIIKNSLAMIYLTTSQF